MQAILPFEFKRDTVLVLEGAPHVPLEVSETAPPTRGGSESAWKEARLETGLQIMVPLFIAAGETVPVDTATKRSVSREASGAR